MAAGIGLPVVDYQIATKNQTQLLAQFQKTASYATDVAYYQANIGKVKTPQDLLNDPKLLNVALSAFQLEGESNATAILRDLLTQDPTQSTSLAQQLIDPRFRAFAQAFSSLRNDNGATISNPTSIAAVLAGFTTNEYQKFVAKTFNDSSLRQALFFQQTVQDTVDVSDTAQLFSQFQQSTGVQQAAANYKNGIANVNSVSDLLNNQPVLDFALQAFGIDPTTVSSATLQRILTEPANASVLTPNAPSQATDPLLISDSRFQQFAQAFSSLSTNGGTTVQSSKSINAIITDYQQTQFSQVLAANNSGTITSDFGSTASSTIGSLLADFQAGSGISTSIAAYQNGIAGISSVSDLVNNPSILNVALGAFNINPTTVSTALVTQLLTNDPTASTSLQQQATALVTQDANVANFVKTFGVLGSNPGGDFTNINNLFQQFTQSSSISTAAGAFQDKIGKITSVSQLVGNTQVLNVALQAFNIDPSTASTSEITSLLNETPTQQASDPLLSSDPRYQQFVQAFSSLRTGQALTSASANSIVSNFQVNQFAQNLATNNPNKANPNFADGSDTINKLLGNFKTSSGVSAAVTNYENQISTVTTVPGLVDNQQLLNVALGAFGIDPSSISVALATQLLSPSSSADPTVAAEATALQQNNPNVQNFVNAFKSLNTDNGAQAQTAASVSAITTGYINNQFQQSLVTRTEEVLTNPSLASPTTLPLGDQRSISTITSAFQANQFAQSLTSKVQEATSSPSTTSLSDLQLIGNATLQAVVFGALGLPTQTGALDPDQQVQALQNAQFDPSKLTKDPNFLQTFINQFLSNAGQQSGATGTSLADVALGVFNAQNNADNGVTPLDLSFLAINTSSNDSSSTNSSANLLSLFA